MHPVRDNTKNGITGVPAMITTYGKRARKRDVVWSPHYKYLMDSI